MLRKALYGLSSMLHLCINRREKSLFLIFISNRLLEIVWHLFINIVRKIFWSVEFPAIFIAFFYVFQCLCVSNVRDYIVTRLHLTTILSQLSDYNIVNKKCYNLWIHCRGKDDFLKLQVHHARNGLPARRRSVQLNTVGL